VARLLLTTDRQISGLKPADKIYEIGIGGSRGLGVRVFPTGLRQFEFRYVAANGTRRRLCLGAYPDLSLAEAYWQAATMGLHGGRRRPKREVTLSNERQMWRNHIQPRLGARPFTELRRADIKVFMRTLVTESGLAAASVASIGSM